MCQANQQFADLLLRHGVVLFHLTDIDALGVPAHEIEDAVADEPVVQHHVGLLHQAKCTKCQQVRIARPGTHQIHLTARWFVAFGCGFFEQPVHQVHRQVFAGRKQVLGNRPGNHRFPETPPPRYVGDGILDPIAVPAGKLGEATVGCRYGCLEAGLEHSGQQWGSAATSDRYKYR